MVKNEINWFSSFYAYTSHPYKRTLYKYIYIYTERDAR